MSNLVEAASSPPIVPLGYHVGPSGVTFRQGKTDIALTTVPAWVDFITRTHSGSDWSIRLVWRDRDDNERARLIPYSALHHCNEILADLASHGLFVLPGEIARFSRFIAISAALPEMRVVRTYRNLGFPPFRTEGKTEPFAFVLPYVCLVPRTPEQLTEPATEIPMTEEVHFHPRLESPMFDAYSAAGTLEDWQDGVSKLIGNRLLMFAALVGFTAPFQALSEMDNVIFHLHGNSSSGKTTALQVAVSVWGMGGDPQASGMVGSLIERWNTTANAIEPIAATHSGMLLAIDELGSSGDSMVSIYNVTSGKGKSRMGETGALRAQHRWALCILSSGEFSLQEKIETSTRRKAKTGEIIRAMDIPIAALAHDTGLTQEAQRTRTEKIKHQCSSCYGTAGPAFMQVVLDHFQTEVNLRARLKEDIDQSLAKLVENAVAGGRQLGPAHVRAMRRFALVAAAGVLAVESGVLPFTASDVEEVILAVSEAWLSALPPLVEGERAVKDIADYVIRNGSQILDYDAWKATGAIPSFLPRDMLAIRKRDLLLFTSDQFAQACCGLSPSEALKQLRDQGILKREGEKLTYRVDIAELNIKRFAFYALDMKRLLANIDQSPVQVDFSEGNYDADVISPPQAIPSHKLDVGPQKRVKRKEFNDDHDNCQDYYEVPDF